MSKQVLPVLINPLARTVPPDAEQQVLALARRSDVEFKPLQVEPEKMQSTLQEIGRSSADIAIWGGDGTVACALKNAAADTRILPLPGGTMNLFHKSIHSGNQTTEDLLREYANGTLAQRDVPVARVNGHEFFVGVICGHLAELTLVREALRRGEPVTALSELFGSNSFDFTKKLKARFEYKAFPSAERDDVVALAAFLRSGESAPLEIGVLNVDNVFDMTTTALEALLDGWENASSIDSMFASKVEVSSPETEMAVTIDGELHHLTGPLVIEHDSHTNAKVLACAPH